MSARIRPARALLSALLWLAPFWRAKADVAYRGFTIDDSRVQRMANLDAIQAALRDQIDIVWAVGVPPEMLRFFQTVRFDILPPGLVPPGNPGLYSARTRTIQVAVMVVNAGHKPIFLHELLHALHDQRLRDGFGNRQIAWLYQAARRIPAYAPRSHMMADDREFFACAGAAYLFGVSDEEPFERAKIRDNQPDLYAYLQETFGPAAGRYHGVLRESRR